MIRHCHRIPVAVLSALFLAPSLALGAVHALFDLGHPQGGPFPSDKFTVRDRSHLTGLRVTLPKPDCSERPSDCEDIDVINTLDGFNLQPRLSVPFDGVIEVDSVTSDTVFLIKLLCRDDDDDDDDGEECDNDDGRRPETVGINQIVWDTFTDTLHVESDELLDQHTRYALIVTRGVRDGSGSPVEATQAFRRFRQTVRGPYKRALLDAIHAARRLRVINREEQIAVASVFTTQSVTAILQKIRDQIKAATPEPADFNLGPGGMRTVFSLDEVTGITFNRHNRVGQPFDPVAVNLSLLRVIPGAVAQIVFGKYVSPDYEVHPGEFIPPAGTRSGIPEVQGANEIYFNLLLRSGSKPPGGWPVAIFGHGNTFNKNQELFFAALPAAHGIATIYINAVGHGFGPLGTLMVNRSGGGTVTFAAGGRGIDQNGDNVIESNEGIRTAAPRAILFFADGIRQTVVDLMQLVRVIEAGMDVDGDGQHDLDPSRIYYFGQSLGGNYGTVFLAVEPSVQAGVLNVAGGPLIENRRLPPGGRPTLGMLLNSRVPSLINSPGINRLGCLPVSPRHFNENMPLRNGIPLSVQLEDGTSHAIQSPVINSVLGATEIQEAVENTEWVSQSGDPAAYAPHLRKDPLEGLPVKSVIYQFATGDQSTANPSTTAVLRAGDLADRTTLLRNDLAFAEDPEVPKNPHLFLTRIANPNRLVAEIARGAQEQIAAFFASDGKEVIHPEPARFFEVPIGLPENLNLIP